MHPLSYRLAFFRKRLAGPKDVPFGFSIVVATYNRSRFLRQNLRSLLSATELPFELIVWDNNSSDGTADVVREFVAAGAPIRYLRCERNIGTNGYARAFLSARYGYLVEADDDVLAVPRGWDREMDRAFRTIPRLGYCALDVVQDRYTNGAKPLPAAYQEETHDGVTLLIGPTGGWFAGTTRRIYDRVVGFIYRPSKPFQREDGYYCDRMHGAGYRVRILKGVRVYHACGEKWNAAFGYHRVWKEKYARDHPALVDRIDRVTPEDLPDLTVPERAIS